jgi:hypothetical protein
MPRINQRSLLTGNCLALPLGNSYSGDVAEPLESADFTTVPGVITHHSLRNTVPFERTGAGGGKEINRIIVNSTEIHCICVGRRHNKMH